MGPKPQHHFHQGEVEIHLDIDEQQFTNNYVNHLNRGGIVEGMSSFFVFQYK